MELVRTIIPVIYMYYTMPHYRHSDTLIDDIFYVINIHCNGRNSPYTPTST